MINVRKINAYTEYKIGDEIVYNDISFYVIKDSSSDDDSITLLKEEPLTVDEVNYYGAGHVNRYTTGSVGTAYDINNDGTVGGMAYYTSETCGNINDTWVGIECLIDYASSEIKYVVDGWKNEKVPDATEARLITYDELITNLGYDPTISSSGRPKANENVPTWVYKSNYWYWTSSQNSNRIWIVSNSGDLSDTSFVSDYDGAVRPVITISKTNHEDETVIESSGDSNDSEKIDETIEEVINDIIADVNDIIDTENKDEGNTDSVLVRVDNTYMSKTFLLIISGFIIAGISVVMFYKIRNKSIK